MRNVRACLMFLFALFAVVLKIDFGDVFFVNKWRKTLIYWKE